LYAFSGGADGGDPMTGLTFDNAGDLFGTANSGGAFGLGLVFQLVHPAAPDGRWTEIVIHSFAGPPNDGSSPGETGVVFDESGNLYGATPAGGITIGEDPLCGDGLYFETTSCGVVFQMTPPATSGGEWGETVIHYFDYTHGAFPVGTPIFDAQGNLYGANFGGGKHRRGSVYRLNHPVMAGDLWKFAVLYSFSDLSNPAGSLTLHGRGDLYGNTSDGGSGYGGVFQLVPPTAVGGTWTENILHSFSYGGDGTFPNANVLFDKAGNLYGTTGSGGYGGGSPLCFQGCGTVFELSPPASGEETWTETILHSFTTGKYDAIKPSTGLIFSKDGSLVGVAPLGGKLGAGLVYEIMP
jgi:hypothetical protein